MINPFKTACLHGISVYELFWTTFTLEQHMVTIISSLKPLQKRTIPNSHTSNAFIKEYIKPLDLPQLLFHAVHTSCSFQSAPLIKEITLSWLRRTFPFQPDIANDQTSNSASVPQADFSRSQICFRDSRVVVLEPSLHTPFVQTLGVWACHYCASSPHPEHFKSPSGFHTSQ